MQIKFEDNSFIELKLTDTGKVQVILTSRDKNNSLNLIISTVEITLNQLAELVADLKIPLPPVYKNTQEPVE